MRGLIRIVRCAHKENKVLVEDVAVVVVVVVSSFALYSVPSFPLSMYINTDMSVIGENKRLKNSGHTCSDPSLSVLKLIIK